MKKNGEKRIKAEKPRKKISFAIYVKIWYNISIKIKKAVEKPNGKEAYFTSKRQIKQ